MKNIILTVAAVVSMAAFATPSWVEISSKANDSAWDGKIDNNPSATKAGNYTAYYCTVAAAEEIFGSSERTAIESYMIAQHAKGGPALAEKATLVDQSGYYAAGQYTFIEYMADAVAQGDYVAILFWGTDAFRVFGSDNAVWDAGTLTFDDEGAAGTVGSWRIIPEPTSGLLMLLGLAGLALKRKRA